ncbi:hypothetical protein Rsub_07783 [Raphidocelis subcapitata]|uniref:methenyltetrahydrofolate cyclohydrolase n=1 Tax=Raphidocelis subcapitata TaxID=307507 RepID=A0A2V0PE39_9CHLO|nr:hypothetical protein Rsub_07783 [Raphidocelis subcapitata]|eukprot:GBF95355.1 hypothetical protein Rsub_07783 [Raphidocelis subcapitata]
MALRMGGAAAGGLVQVLLRQCAPSTLPARHAAAAASAAASTTAAAAAPQRGLATAAPDAAPVGVPRARILDGRAVAAEWEFQLGAEVVDLTRQIGRPPGLAVVQVGERPDSCLYVSRKQEAAARAGIDCSVHRLPQDVSQEVLCARVAALCADPRVDGVLVQLPLPPHLDEESVMGSGALDPRKDVDGFHPLNMGRMLMRGRARAFVPATPLGVMELLARSGLDVAGRSAVVLGDSNVVGTPLSCLLRDRGAAAVTVCHRVSLTEWFEDQDQVQRRRAHAMACLPQLPGLQRPRPSAGADAPPPPPPPPPDRAAAALADARRAAAVLGSCQFESAHLPDITRTADFLIVAVGHPGLVRADWVKPGAVVVDVGINVVPAPPCCADGAAAAPGAAAGAELAAREASLGRSPRYQTSATYVAAPRDSSSSGGGGGGGGAGGEPQGGFGGFGALAVAPGYQVVGDVAADEVAAVASALTPVPGGVGPMTISALLSNTIQAARYGAGLQPFW